MDAQQEENDDALSSAPRWHESGVWLLGWVAILVIGFTLEDIVGIPFVMTLRVSCAALCMVFVYKLGEYYPGEQWPRISLWLALFVNVGIFFTPLVDRPASRGELLLFALPDAIVVLLARTLSYRVADTHQGAVRQQMILGLVLAVAFCTVIFTLELIGPHTRQ